MALARALSAFVHGLDLAMVPGEVRDHAKTLILDALACILAGAGTEAARLARRSLRPAGQGRGEASILPSGEGVDAGAAALVNGAALRALDLMDVYVDQDVCHPSEAVPALLALAEASGASGRGFLEAAIGAFALHARMAGRIPLHSRGLHHVGQAAWVVPLVAGRLLGLGEAATANALALCAGRLLVPEGFARGQITNVKALGYALIARDAIELARFSAAGLRGQPDACEELLGLLNGAFAMTVEAAGLLPDLAAGEVERIWLKAYPAQYALQPLIAAAAAFRNGAPDRVAQIRKVCVRVSRRTCERAADASKYRPASAEAADHSLPFCVAAALLDGGLAAAALTGGRWRDREVLDLMARVVVEPLAGDLGYAVGPQEIELQFAEGGSLRLACRYPAPGVTWRVIARGKLAASLGEERAAVVARLVDDLESLPTLAPLLAALAGGRAGAPFSA